MIHSSEPNLKLLFFGDLHCVKGLKYDCVEELVKCSQDLNPDIIAFSGDLTFRARPSQFRMAEDILRSLKKPIVMVPGNHDIPLYDLFSRITKPFQNWNACFSNMNAKSSYSSNHVNMFGLKTVVPFFHQKGVLSKYNREQLLQCCSTLSSDLFNWRCVLMHQQLYNLPGHYRPGKVVSSEQIAQFFDSCKIDVVLFGHVHYPIVIDARDVFKGIKRRVTLIGCGTIANSRTRGPFSQNSFQFLTFSSKDLVIDTFLWNTSKFCFEKWTSSCIPRSE